MDPISNNIGANLRAWRQAAAPGNLPQVQRLTESTAATLYGCCGIFDLCGDADLMSLSFEGQNPLLDWIGWQATLECIIRRMFISYVEPAKTQGVCSTGYLADPCADPYSFDWGKCEFELFDFARLRRVSPTRDVTENALKLCAAQPRYRLDGTPITDDREWEMRMMTEVLLQDLKRMVINGNRAVGGQFDGLDQLVRTSYTDPVGHKCKLMDSNVLAWNNQTLDGGAGITWNGTAIGATYDFIDVLLAVYRRIRQRILWAPALAAQNMRPGDMVLVMPSFMIQCLLDFYTCWSVCPGSAIDTYEARTFRNSLNGGMFGAGRIWLDGFEIPIVPYDWELIKTSETADIYFLTGSVGNIKLIQGQYLDMRPVPAAGGVLGYYTATDGGRLLTWPEIDHTCIRLVEEMRPRLLMWAPWAECRFEDVKCQTPGGPLSPDPCNQSFFGETSFTAPVCDEVQPQGHYPDPGGR